MLSLLSQSIFTFSGSFALTDLSNVKPRFSQVLKHVLHFKHKTTHMLTIRHVLNRLAEFPVLPAPACTEVFRVILLISKGSGLGCSPEETSVLLQHKFVLWSLNLSKAVFMERV